MKAVGIHVFAGAFAHGVRKYADIEATLEAQPHFGGKTFQHNFQKTAVYTDWDPFINTCRRPDLVFANPPCAPYSRNSSKKHEDREFDADPRFQMTRDTVRAARELEPMVFAYESVPGAWQYGCDQIKQFAREFNSQGYNTSVWLHDPVYYGVPQKRPRMMFVAHRYEWKPRNPLSNVVGAYETISRLNDPGELIENRKIFKRRDLLKRIPPGTQPRKIWDQIVPPELWDYDSVGRVIGRPPFSLRRLNTEGPSHTISGFPVIHPTEPRGLGVKEMAALCGIGPDFEFIGPEKADQISRGVCPAIGEIVAEATQRSLSDGSNHRIPGYIRVIDDMSPEHRKIEFKPI